MATASTTKACSDCLNKAAEICIVNAVPDFSGFQIDFFLFLHRYKRKGVAPRARSLNRDLWHQDYLVNSILR